MLSNDSLLISEREQKELNRFAGYYTLKQSKIFAQQIIYIHVQFETLKKCQIETLLHFN